MALLFGLSIPSWTLDSEGQHSGKGKEVRLVTYNPVPQIQEKGREQTMDWLTEVQPDNDDNSHTSGLAGCRMLCLCCALLLSPRGGGTGNQKGCFRVRWRISLQRQPDCIRNLIMRLVQKEAENPCQPVVCLESSPSESLIG